MLVALNADRIVADTVCFKYEGLVYLQATELIAYNI